MMGGKPAIESEIVLHQTTTVPRMAQKRPRTFGTANARTETQQEQDATNHNSRVTFDSIEIIEFPITMGDYPYCSSGCPLTTEWQALQRRTYSLEEFERTRPPRKSSCEKLSAAKRERILQGYGWSSQEIQSHRQAILHRQQQEEMASHRVNRWSAE